MMLDRYAERGLLPLGPRVTNALTLSLALHLALFAVIEAGLRFGWWQKLGVLEFMTPAKLAPDQREPEDEKMQLIFVQVDPSQAVDQEPENARHYSSRNVRAANRETPEELRPLPKIEGTQDQVAHTLSPGRTMEPASELEAPPPAPEPEPAPQPRPEPVEGTLALARPAPDPIPPVEPPPRPRPRTLAAARQDQGINQMPMRQEGGAPRVELQPGFDTKATPFGQYDEALIAAIRTRWHALLDRRGFASDGRGKVVLEFRLKYDGRITDMKVTENTVGDVLSLVCQRAVLEPAPYAPWPSDMRRLVQTDYREVRFTFYYN